MNTGSDRFYDFEFRVIGWLDYLKNQVISLLFPSNILKYAEFTKDRKFSNEKDLEFIKNEVTNS